MKYVLNNGVEIPALGFGVFQTPAEETSNAVLQALNVGYRHIDTAASYGNEVGVGQAVRDSGIPRDEIFIETKLWISDYGYEAALHGFEKSVTKLGVDTVDLMLLHQPLPSQFEKTLDAYRALEELYMQGRIRAIGISNFMPDVLAAFLPKVQIIPAVNQIELHPYFQQKELQNLHEAHGIHTQAWSPIGGITFYREGGGGTLSDELLIEIAQKYGKTPAQVMLRWHLQNGRSAIPKSVNPARIASNFDVFDFELSDLEVNQIDSLSTDMRSGPDPSAITLGNYGFPIPEA